jgi:hypothetical protein
VVSRARSASDSPPAPRTPRQFTISTFKPLSRIVGTLMPGVRDGDEIAIARKRPDRTCGANSL